MNKPANPGNRISKECEKLPLLHDDTILASLTAFTAKFGIFEECLLGLDSRVSGMETKHIDHQDTQVKNRTYSTALQDELTKD